MKYTLTLTPVTIGKKHPQTRRLPPNPNARMHFMVRVLWKNAFQEQLAWEIKKAGIPKAGFIRVKVINKACQPMDDDNLFGASKGLFDTFTEPRKATDKYRMGIVPDDSRKHMLQEVENVKVAHRKDEAVEIEVEIV